MGEITASELASPHPKLAVTWGEGELDSASSKFLMLSSNIFFLNTQ
jgi:hypothetical protein